MEGTTPIPPPIPGYAPLGDPDDPVQALIRFYRAFNRRDLSAMEQVWERSAEISLVSPIAGIVRGWPAARAGYARLFTGEDRIETEFFDYMIHELDDAFYAVGRERGTISIGGRSVEATGYATNVFRRGPDGSWKLVHHHVSMRDPQGPPK